MPYTTLYILFYMQTELVCFAHKNAQEQNNPNFHKVTCFSVWAKFIRKKRPGVCGW